MSGQLTMINWFILHMLEYFTILAGEGLWTEDCEDTLKYLTGHLNVEMLPVVQGLVSKVLIYHQHMCETC